MTTQKAEITVSIRYFKEAKPVKYKGYVISFVDLLIGGKLLGQTILVGIWDKSQVLREYRNNPRKFRMIEGAEEVMKAMGHGSGYRLQVSSLGS